MTSGRLISIALLAGAACAKKEPEPRPTPIVQQTIAIPDSVVERIKAQTGARSVTRVVVIQYSEPPDDIFVDMTLAAAGWAKRSIGARTIGVYQPTSASPRFRTAIEAVTNHYAFRPIGPSDFATVCGGNGASRTSITTRTAKCSMKYVDAVLTFNSVRLGRDSGYVGVNITRVPSGATRAERTYYCITLTKKDAQWDARHAERIVDATRCPRKIP